MFSSRVAMFRGQWTPLQLNPYVWYDASDSSTVTRATYVTAWLDKSGNGRNLTGVGNMTYTATQNGLNVITINNTSQNQYFEKTGLSITGNQITMFTVHKNTPGSGKLVYGRPFTTLPTTGNDYDSQNSVILTYGVTANAVSWFRANTLIKATPTFTMGSWVSVVGWRSGTTGYVWKDGTKSASGSANSANFNITRIRVGADNALVDSGMNGAVAEKILFDRALSDAEVDQVNGYLAWKWGLPLPAGHAYLSSPPYL